MREMTRNDAPPDDHQLEINRHHRSQEPAVNQQRGQDNVKIYSTKTGMTSTLPESTFIAHVLCRCGMLAPL
jgi:hypothetical protein